MDCLSLCGRLRSNSRRYKGKKYNGNLGEVGELGYPWGDFFPVLTTERRFLSGLIGFVGPIEFGLCKPRLLARAARLDMSRYEHCDHLSRHKLHTIQQQYNPEAS